MQTYVKTFVFLFFIVFTELKLSANETKSSDYEKYVNEIVNNFVDDVKKKYALHCYGSGGSMPTDVEKIEVFFISYSKLTVDGARKMEVDAVQKLLHRINTHEKIRPYLREYPFDASRVNVSISFRAETDRWPLDGSVALVFLAKNKIFYEAAEMKMSSPVTISRVDDNNKWTTEVQPGELEETLTPLLEETYEEALKIVGITPKPNQKQQ